MITNSGDEGRREEHCRCERPHRFGFVGMQIVPGDHVNIVGVKGGMQKVFQQFRALRLPLIFGDVRLLAQLPQVVGQIPLGTADVCNSKRLLVDFIRMLNRIEEKSAHHRIQTGHTDQTNMRQDQFRALKSFILPCIKLAKKLFQLSSFLFI